MTKKSIMTLAVFLLAVSSAAATDEATNKKILRDAVVGAVTGYAATEATNDEPAVTAKENAPAPESSADKEKGKKKNFKHKKKDKKRPYGWDQGKKTGWGGGDVPPGLAKKD